MKVEYWGWIRRDDLKHNRDKLFLFGDNVEQKGLGGQAKEMRGEPNAIGVPTKKSPHMRTEAFFCDSEYDDNIRAIDKAFEKILEHDRTIVIPTMGLGTGYAKLKHMAPRTWEYLQMRLNELQ